MSSKKIKKITIFIKIIDNLSVQKSIIKRLNPNDYLSDIRKELIEHNVINDMLIYLKEENDEEFGEIEREDEMNFLLKDIITIKEGQNILYLKRNYWKILSNQFKLDYGRTMSIDGIKIAEKQAFIINNCELKEINKYKKGRIEFESKEDWMKKTNLFVDVENGNNNITNFAKFGLSVVNLHDKSFINEIQSAYQYTEIGKVSLKFSKQNLENLKLTDEFKNDVIDAINSKNPRERFKKITKEYGQFIPTEIILGGKVYFNDTDIIGEKSSKFYSFNYIRLLGGKHPDDENFDEKNWIESLKNYQNWECIEFKNPLNIFHLLFDDLRKQAFKSIGKRILYTSTENCDYYLNESGRHKNFELKNIPQNILEIIHDEESDCDIFATVVDTNANSKKVFFNCQILRKPNTKPSIIIHGIQKSFQKRRYNLKIKMMIIGYDKDFNFILPDTISVELIKNVYDPQNLLEFYSIPLKQKLNSMVTNGIPFFGIPVLSNLDSSNKSIIIGHNFCNTLSSNDFNIDVYSYCLKKKRYDKLPHFVFCTIIISDYPTSNFYASLPFNFKFLRNPFIDLNTSNISPKCVSLYLSKNNNYNPIFLSQKINQIKIKYLNCKCKRTCFVCKNKKVKISRNESDIECIVFD
ncbi:hypothetical protein RhiirA5_402643 [Rhizophagus irregularis]|uniref:DUF7431 domain-containing protein n=1 Tax=Rhizophagus irregularis TaxID=588596 RepID=A0A2N0P4V9_9GLOM|nr:hypothetical protein RhiirA5_402643 [Rhizophagus irregularis]